MGTCLSKKSSQDLPLNHPKTLTLIDTKLNPQNHKSVFVIKHQNNENSRNSSSKKPSFDFDNHKGFSDKGKEIVVSEKIYENGFSDKNGFEEKGFSDKNGFYENSFEENGFSDKNYEKGISGEYKKGFGEKGLSNVYEKGICENDFSDENKKSFGEKSFSDKSFENGFEEVSLADRISRHRRSRSSGTNTRRVSRSPSRRSQSPVSRNNNNNLVPNSGNLVPNGNNVVAKSGPGKMVAVPATVGENVVKRVSVRRNVGDPTVMGFSPRAQSPVKRVDSISRSNSRRGEYSPYRRNALGDIDQNCSGNQAHVTYQKTNGENLKSNRVITQGTCSGPMRSIHPEEYQMKNEDEGSQQLTANIPFRTEGSRVENLKRQTVASRSSRLSQDLDLNPDVQLNPAPSSYTALLLKDIQSFHQKSAPAISLPPCVSKAQSIMDAVADLNSGTRSNLYAELSDQRRKNSTPVPFNRDDKYGSHVSGDVAEPSFQNYITVTRGTMDIEQQDEEESSGSNSFVSGNQHLVSSSSWEPNSSESTGYCTSSRSNTRENKKTSMSSKGQRQTFSECAVEKKREPDQQRSGIGRYRVGSGRS